MDEKKIIQEGVVNFYSGKKEYRSLSNFWERDVQITYTGRIYESGEHCFHGEKYIRIGELCEDEVRKNKLIQYGMTFLKPSVYKSCSEAKKMGGKKGLLLNSIELSIWDTLSVEVQKEICIWKFDNYEEVRNDLLKSGNKILVHPALRCSEEKLQNRFWEGKAIINDEGKVIILGRNMLGNTWMDFR